MKKIIVALISICLIIIVGGAVLLSVNSKPGATQKMTSTESSQVTTIPTQAIAFSSIQDALTKSVSLSCDFTDETGRHMQSFIKNGAVRVIITAKIPQESGNAIIKDKKIYFWNTTTAMMMDLPTITGTTKQGSAENKGVSTQSDVLGSMEKYKNTCKPAMIDDTLFIPPATITFTDFSKMMPSGVQGAPSVSGMQAVPSVNSQNYQKMMQQYQQQYQQK